MESLRWKDRSGGDQKNGVRELLIVVIVNVHRGVDKIRLVLTEERCRE